MSALPEESYPYPLLPRYQSLEFLSEPVPCQCDTACLLGGTCDNPSTGEDRRCDRCRDNPGRHCHMLNQMSVSCQLKDPPWIAQPKL